MIGAHKQEKIAPGRVIIIGGGAGGVFTLIGLKNKLEDALSKGMINHEVALDITILEQGKELYGGPVWGSDSTLPDYHFANIYAGKTHGTPRQTQGDKDRKNVASIIQELTAKFPNVKVHIQYNTEATSLNRKNKEFILTTASGEEKRADYVVLASGHWEQKGDMEAAPGIFKNPWPAKELQQRVAPGENVAVIGTGLTGVDAILTVADKYFPKTLGKKGASSDNKGHITAYSAHGMLPLVLGYTMGVRSVQIQFYEDIKQAKSLDEVYGLIKKQVLDVYKDDSKLNSRERAIKEVFEKSKTIEQAVSAFYERYHKMDKVALLRDSLHDAEESLKSQKPIEWQSFLWKLSEKLDECYHHNFSVEDRRRFLKVVKPLYTKLAYGMVVENGRHILSLMENGLLDVKTTGGYKSVHVTDGLPGGEIEYVDTSDAKGKPVTKTMHHNAIVVAGVDDPHTVPYSCPLLNSIFANGLARPEIQEFSTLTGGKEAFQQQLAAERNWATAQRTTFINNKRYFQSFGGIDVINGTNEALTPNGERTHLYVVGPLINHQTPLLHGRDRLDSAAKNISRRIVDDIINKEHRRENPKPKPQSAPDPARVKFHTYVNGDATVYLMGGMPSQAAQEHVAHVIGRNTGVKVHIASWDDLPADRRAELEKLTPVQQLRLR